MKLHSKRLFCYDTAPSTLCFGCYLNHENQPFDRCLPYVVCLGRSVEALLAREDMGSNFSSPALRHAGGLEQVEGALGARSKQDCENLSASLEFAHSTREGSWAGMDTLSEAMLTVRTMASDAPPPDVEARLPPIGSCLGNVWGGDVATRGEEELSPDLSAQGSEASLLSLGPMQTSSDEPGEDRVAEEDWLEAVRAIDLGGADAAFG